MEKPIYPWLPSPPQITTSPVTTEKGLPGDFLGTSWGLPGDFLETLQFSLALPSRDKATIESKIKYSHCSPPPPIKYIIIRGHRQPLSPLSLPAAVAVRRRCHRTPLTAAAVNRSRRLLPLSTPSTLLTTGSRGGRGGVLQALVVPGRRRWHS